MPERRSLLLNALVIYTLMIAISAWTVPSRAETFLPDPQLLVAEDAAAGDLFGFSMATDGRWLAVGAKFADTFAGEDGGAVYLYRKGHYGQWDLVQKLIPLHGGAGDEFGESVALRQNRLVVGARSAEQENGTRSGVAYVFNWRGWRQGWVEAGKVEPFDGSDGDEFGRSVAVGPKRVIVGARFADTGASEELKDTGAVYVFCRLPDRKGWILEQKLTDPQGMPEDEFGRAIAYDPSMGGRLAVGSREAGGTGAVLIFGQNRDAGAWQLNQVLTADDGQDRDYFGQSVVMSRDLLVVGARDADTQADKDTGAAYIYRLNHADRLWTLEQKLEPAEGKKKDQFGFALAINNLKRDRIAVSARRADTELGVDTGSVYTFAYDRLSGHWRLTDTLLPANLAQDDEFGQSLAMDPVHGGWLFIGADQSALSGHKNAGAVYHYTFDPRRP